MKEKKRERERDCADVILLLIERGKRETVSSKGSSASFLHFSFLFSFLFLSSHF